MCLIIGLAKEERLMKPELSFAREHIIVHAGEPFTITCRGSQGLTWLRGKDPPGAEGRWRVYEQKCSDRPWLTCSTLATDRAFASDTGYVTCLYSQFRSSEELKAKIYVFVKDIQSLEEASLSRLGMTGDVHGTSRAHIDPQSDYNHIP
ncbi:UNVERIFIED_CONTAM: hypothetical protein K2H54_048907 [Gekko kuhli]